MMNRKGMVFFWILLVILLGVGISIMVNFSFQAGEAKGLWALSLIRAKQEAEKDLLIRDSKAIETAQKVDLEFSSLIFKEDLGCGVIQNVPFWNQKERFCALNVEDKFAKQFNLLFDRSNIFNYTLHYQSRELIGKTSQIKMVTPADSKVIPTEQRSASLFTPYEAYLIKPFDLRYTYNPSFRIKINLSLPFYEELEKQAHLLVRACQDATDLKSCLDQEKNESWKYGKCGQEEYVEEGRKVIFCVEKSKTEKLNFALDFTSPSISSPKEVQVSLQGTQVKVSFNAVTDAEQYQIYYTNWNPNPESYPQEAKNLFFASQGKYFYAVKTIAATQECPTEHQVNTAYLCGGKILYWVEDPQIVPGEEYYFGVTSIKGTEESLLYELIKLDTSG